MFKHIQSTLRIKYELGDNDSKIINRVAEKIEGLCGADGMVIHNSTHLISRTPPFLNKMENGGLVEVIVRYEADAVTLPSGTVVNAKVIKTVRSDSVAVYSVGGHVVATILLPSILQDAGLRDTIIPEHYVDIKILESEFGTGWNTINAVGVVVPSSSSSSSTTDAKPLIETNERLHNIREEAVGSDW